ncbi:HlyD family type I secretion periplasmic adaptor subunit [Pseudohalioglobus lutimaris]|uniref:Membrane fusion protein (MFP) family protein n=1 Tax=Pseudohalioglobus lutimaris TaxID=1737061 RepID=A0A2N5X5L1_9GAMM|nr:HlyD family type I secretion periplasmic adaptor subunit [Pseudohalioglobus lutimaris]PLW69776.1 hypothetical protein C0039_07165 [Pseudohalioglobus lutimaris]
MNYSVEQPKKKSHAGMPRARARFLAQAIELEEQGIADVVKVSIYTIMALIAAILVWMSLTEIGEVTVAKGSVVPAGYVHNIQHLEGGIVDSIKVQDGDRVEAGTTLVVFAPPASQSDLDQLAIRQTILQLDMARLKALKSGEDADFGDFAQDHPELAVNEELALRTQRASRNSERELADASIEQRMSELTRARNQVTVLKRESALLQEQVNIRQELAKRNAISQSDLLRMKSEHASAQSDLKSAVDSVLVASHALTEERKRRAELLARQEKALEHEFEQAQNELATVHSAMVKARDKVDRLRVTAPVTGIVQGIAVNTINAVVQPGEVIMQIVPVEDELIVESRLMPNEVGYVRAGQLADVRVDSFDSTRYGTIKGTVRQVSPSTYLDENANPYYKVKVGLERSWLGEDPARMTVIPGMSVQVDILTGSKTIMHYLLKPVTRGFHSAFTQR